MLGLNAPLSHHLVGNVLVLEVDVTIWLLYGHRYGVHSTHQRSVKSTNGHLQHVHCLQIQDGKNANATGSHSAVDSILYVHGAIYVLGALFARQYHQQRSTYDLPAKWNYLQQY